MLLYVAKSHAMQDFAFRSFIFQSVADLLVKSVTGFLLCYALLLDVVLFVQILAVNNAVVRTQDFLRFRP